MVPEGWQPQVLAEGIELISGQHIAANDYTYTADGVPYLTGPDDFPRGEIIVTKYTKKPRVTCRVGDILITVKGAGVGKLARANQDYCISNEWC